MSKDNVAVIEEIRELKKSLSPVQELLKLANAPASRLGMSPVEFIEKMTAGGQVPMVFGPDGTPVPVVGYDPLGRRLGPQFGKFLDSVARSTPSLNLGGYDEIARHTKRLLDPTERGGFGTTKAALAESSGVTGGYAIPPMFSNQLQLIAAEDVIVEPRASKLPMTALTLQVPSLDMTTVQGAGNPAFYGGVQATWTAEAQTRTESEPQFRQTELKAHELSFILVASNTLLADQAVALDALITQLMGGALGWYRDYAYLQGNGVGKPMGLINAAATIQVTRAGGAGSSTFAYSDVVTMMSKLWAGLWRQKTVAWVMHQSVLPKLAQLSDSSGRAIWIPLNMGSQEAFPQSGGMYSAGWLLGIPVLFSEKVPVLSGTGDVGLYDFSKYLLGQRMDLQIDVSPHVKFANNQMMWRIVWRGDGQPWLNNPITLADGAFTVSPFIVLK